VKGLIVRWILNAIALLITAHLITGMEVSGLLSALVAAMVLGVVNAVIRPIILVLTLPINIATLGLFTLIVNGLMLKAVSSVVVGFHVQGFWATVVGALLLSILSGILSMLVRD
jgi:putative membrane protein